MKTNTTLKSMIIIIIPVAVRLSRKRKRNKVIIAR